MRALLSRHLVGSGVELGPGTSPFPLAFPGATCTYIDHFEPDVNRGLFPELGEEHTFQPADVTCDFDTDRLKMLDDQSQDFVIASHLLEHLANPISMLDEMHRVLRPGGIALVLLPDMRVTFDRDRPVTPLDHLIAHYEDDITEVDDDHIEAFIAATEPPDRFASEVTNATPEARAELFGLHRQRSIHAHCWTETDFQPVIEYAIGTLRHRWEFVDGILTADEVAGNEFGYVLRRGLVELPPDVAAERFRSTWEAWRRDRAELVDALTAAAPPAERPPVDDAATEEPPMVEPGPPPEPTYAELVGMLVRRTLAKARRTIRPPR
jgi:SAM-dependent methyltransferase